MRITVRQIADELGVSAATVSRVLNGREDSFISQATRTRVLDTARRLGYQTNRAARALVTGRTHLVAYGMPSLSHTFYASTLHHVVQQVRAHDFEIIVTEMGTHHDWEPEHSCLIQFPVDGVLVFDFLANEETLRQAVGAIPCVSLGPYYSECTHFVGIDLFAGAQQAMEHLITSGRKRIAFLTLGRVCHAGDARFDAYTLMMQQAGLEPNFLLSPDTTRASARQLVNELLQSGPPSFDALFCRNDEMALGAYRALRQNGVAIPETVALVGCDGIQETEYTDIPLSTIRQPIQEMFAIGWQYLEEAMKNPGIAHRQTLLKAHLEIRESSAS